MDQQDEAAVENACRAAGMQVPPAQRYAIQRYVSNSRTHPCDRKRPSYPQPKRLVINGEIPNQSGVYFFWRQGHPFYVGQAARLSRRLTSHRMKEFCDEIAWLTCKQKNLNYFESFYIGVLRPIANFGAVEEVRIDQDDRYYIEKRIGGLVIGRSAAFLQPTQEPLPEGAIISFKHRAPS